MTGTAKPVTGNYCLRPGEGSHLRAEIVYSLNGSPPGFDSLRAFHFHAQAWAMERGALPGCKALTILVTIFLAVLIRMLIIDFRVDMGGGQKWSLFQLRLENQIWTFSRQVLKNQV